MVSIACGILLHYDCHLWGIIDIETTRTLEYILKYFPDLTADKQQQLTAFIAQLRSWNERINLISRQDTAEIEVRHVLHALSIAKWTSFKPGTRILDLGTGGGLPGIPLAIYYPDCSVTMIDGTGKKITAVQSMIGELGLTNASAIHTRAEQHHGDYDVIVSRAVAPLHELRRWSKDILQHKKHAVMIVLKGGDLRDEIGALGGRTKVEQVSVYNMFSEPYFMEKYLLHVQL
jgi:16S rRNA (guanine527-N7)-methyltransferase